MKKLFICILMSVVVGACSGFLDEKSRTRVDGDEVYDSEDALEAAVYGCIGALMGGNNMPANTQMEFLHNSSGLVHWGYSTTRLTDSQERWIGALALTMYARNSYNYAGFKQYYVCINRCNRLLEKLPDSPVETAFKEKIHGEALFLRALCYFYLVRQWGDVPVYMSSSVSSVGELSPRVSFWEVYRLIVEDLKNAALLMKDYSADQAPTGRGCKWAAKALLSEVYLTIGTLLAHPDDNFWNTALRTPDFSAVGVSSAGDAFRLSLAYSEDVIENGPYTLAPNYAKLFRWTDPEDWALGERIFCLTAGPDVSSGNNLAAYSLPQYPEGTVDVANAAVNYGIWRPDRWLFQIWCEAYGGKKGSGSSAKYIFVSSPDPRLDVTIWHTSYYKINTDPPTKVNLYPTNSRIRYATSRVYEPYYKKYLDPKFNGAGASCDMYILRFAEMYLNAAEACANLCTAKGDAYWNKAFAYIGVIHQRARHKPDGTEATQPIWAANRFDTNPTPINGRNDNEGPWDPVQGLIDGIFWERVFEMSAECHEFFDTHRMGARWLADNIAAPKNRFLRNQMQQYSNAANDETGRVNGYTSRLYGDPDFQYPTDPQELRKSLLCAFPYSEIMYNSMISEADQNDYYIR
ncbi:MAG: RagB/SusD family nutrient uptake outer membrane protein [Bacteroidales bacterium]|nr:RagB/SusD family nutrient uptake outer membrane protein [Bacteroidales bacterium]